MRFGVRRSGPDSIIAFLARLYADTGFVESRLLRQAPPELIFVRPDVTNGPEPEPLEQRPGLSRGRPTHSSRKRAPR